VNASPTPSTEPAPTRILVIGASGAVGRFLLPRLMASGASVLALSRRAAPAWSRPLVAVEWCRGDLYADIPRLVVDTLVCLGPLDGFVAWIERAAPTGLRRVLAFSSTSASSKRDSIDPRDRELAQRLLRSEARLADWCHANGAAWTVLRPTLIYGAGVDRNLSRIAAIARRWRFFLLPREAIGLRQPVHADDLAGAVQGALRTPASRHRAYDLPGGETLTHREMVRRVLDCLPRRARLLLLPGFVFRTLLVGARLLPALRDVGSGMIERLSRDLVYDDADAVRDFNYAPRRFAPQPEMFETPRDEAATSSPQPSS
jgi:nucleoside-diphosphate-sugar epimerase